MRVFFYGTLCDPQVLALVAGRRAARVQHCGAHVLGFRAACVRGQAYPALARAPGLALPGHCIAHLTPVEWRRIIAYEGRGYVIRRIRVRLDHGGGCTALAFLPAGRLSCAPKDWSLAHWRLTAKPALLKRLRRGTWRD